MVVVAPSLLASDLLDLGNEVESVIKAGADWLHIDIMDGHFVPNLSFGPDLLKLIKKKENIFLDVHFMITDADRMIDVFYQAGADRITVHPESTFHLHRTLQKISSLGIKAGLAINPATPLEFVYPVLHMVDLVLMMTVNPGYGGQKFLVECLKKIEDIRQYIYKDSLDVFVQVDGGINDITAPMVINAGANVLVSGNYIFSGIKTLNHYKERIKKLRCV